jgi:hypothetical protein
MTVTIDILSLGKWIGIAAVLFAAVTVAILLVSNIRRFFASRNFDGRDRDAMRKRWDEVEALLAQGGELSAKLAIIEADKLLDHALKSIHMPGTSLGERLKFAQYKYPKLKDVWWAHKVRNRLVHEADYRIPRRDAKGVIVQFEKTLKLIGAI